MSNDIKKVKQVHYGALEIDTREKDCLPIWGGNKGDLNVIHIDNKSIECVIKILQDELEKRKSTQL